MRMSEKSDFFILSNIWRGGAGVSSGELIKVTRNINFESFDMVLTRRHPDSESEAKKSELISYRRKEQVISLCRLYLLDLFNNCPVEWLDTFTYNIKGLSFELDYDPTRFMCFPEIPGESPDDNLSYITDKTKFLNEIVPLKNKIIDELISFIDDFLCILK